MAGQGSTGVQPCIWDGPVVNMPGIFLLFLTAHWSHRQTSYPLAVHGRDFNLPELEPARSRTVFLPRQGMALSKTHWRIHMPPTPGGRQRGSVPDV